jgi:carbon-monoxide dehydrogenase small subunit
MELEFTLNGRKVRAPDIEGHATLLSLLRDHFDLKGAKEGCGVGECGACTVLLDDEPINACLAPAWKAYGRSVTTIEGIGSKEDPHPLQRAFVEDGAIQCGFCTPGMIMAALALLKASKKPDMEEIQSALSGNLCRCTGYKQILHAVQRAADMMEEIDNG